MAALYRAHILLVEDDDTTAQITQALLAAFGHRVTRVADGLGALAAVDAQTHDLVLVDLRMPGMDGVDFARALRAGGGPAAGLPVVALTAHAGQAERALCRAAGMDGFLSKPIEPGELRDLIDALCR